MRKISIAVMGCASIAKRLMIPAIQGLPEYFELAAIGSRTSGKAEEFSKAFGVEGIVGYENLLKRQDIEAIYMPLPTGLHEEWITRCLEAGKHLLVEKSFAMDLGSAMRLIEMAKERELTLMENFMFRHHSQHNFTWEMLREKKLGEIRVFRSQFGFPPLDKDNFRYDKAAGGGALLDAGAYTVKASQWFLGQGLEVISATLYLDPVTGVDIFGNVSLISRDNIVAQLSFGFDNFYQCNYEFWGSRGRLLAERAFTPKPAERPKILLEQQGERIVQELEPDNHFMNILKELHRSVAERDGSRHLEDILDQSRILTAIQDTAIKIKL
ncbi:Gfo/Idh/MocA family oxidoreductase [Flavitalea sp. BT771]|uniref:Gfo/Idh/MocA family protein n=1 Tax=Flavitalea sp. BT771 TaxID=3063329 RepID=UPI0026E33E4C|nr:Gfo/Idh/MocA family oxidoreductase [Flavitalea sp. BT771]MDO6434157.1 Gfo/Idh/MocA family oxidoreductase [Flavitalea sp. BT771]MDV6223057.1 Gfo/Idh/MocA family oxidoreductase [Flavitalea sp. BT771]